MAEQRMQVVDPTVSEDNLTSRRSAPVRQFNGAESVPVTKRGLARRGGSLQQTWCRRNWHCRLAGCN